MVGTVGNESAPWSSTAQIRGTGETPTKWRIPSSAFQEALQDTATQSGLFKSVNSDRAADYQLEASLFSQQATLPWGSYILMVGAKYKLIETASNKEIWSGSFYTECEASSFDILSGPATNECAMRKNLLQLFDNLSRLSL